MRRFAPLLCALVIVPPAAARGLGSYPDHIGASATTIVGLRAGTGFMAAPVLRRAGGRELAPSVGLWELRTAAARRVVPRLRALGVVQLVQPTHTLRRAVVRLNPDPLSPAEWWQTHVGDDPSAAPAAGVPVTVVDTGIDLSHPEFAGRPDTAALNVQRVTDTTDDFHGTAVASVVAAPANGVGLIGVYPQTALRSYDVDLSHRLTDSGLIQGIDAASAVGRGVINLSLGGRQYNPALQLTIDSALRRGALVVAASGNDRENGNPPTYPADMAHVLTVAATDENDRPTSFSSSAPGVDLAAPGVDIPVAVPTIYRASGYDTGDGTSFAAPIVSGAAAWVWTARSNLDVTQIFDLMRWSARDVAARGFDVDTGFGVLDIPVALTRTAPATDPSEPNDDVALVKPGAAFASGMPPLTTSSAGRAAVSARVDVTDDPDDVYRLWVPAHKSATVTVRGDANVDLDAWAPSTRTVAEKGAALKRHLVAKSRNTGTKADSVVIRNRSSRAAFYYADVFPARNVGNADYRLTVTTR
jgi:subtilisin family serine protease